MITKAIKKAFVHAERKGWDRTYWAFDIHDTIIKPNWSTKEIPTEFYPLAKETLQIITKRKDVVSILYTCSHPHELKNYLRFFEENNIFFDYVNENPEVRSENYGYYENKPYFNVLFEDKAGFDPLEDWEEVMALMTSDSLNTSSN
ncbi:hypothetical protein LVD15_13360 [Fulvivirga maritima]|uniref:hypothetical protein n=1 Tax=Fulvivirga maritima TaxID=2904247 RepID=UPI001F1C8740|nr:hypothetical protein [Fulvivirga maritima]UII29372.1 hypothetical protein LVD15_13360 [Fulvivirga maritima]